MKKTLIIIMLLTVTSAFSAEIRFTDESKKGLKEISRKVEAKEMLDIFVTAGAFYGLIGRPSLEGVINVTSTDWDMFGKAINANNQILKGAINKTVDFQLLHHHQLKANDQFDKETIRSNLKFWQEMKKRINLYVEE